MAGVPALCRDFPELPDLADRRGRLREFVSRRTPSAGYLLGDVTKGGKPATAEERILLEGRQANGVPRGLTRCAACPRWRGSCLDPEPCWDGLVMRVACLCENDTRCARCGLTLAAERLGSNSYDERDGKIWHVPAFMGLSHRCADDPA